MSHSPARKSQKRARTQGEFQTSRVTACSMRTGRCSVRSLVRRSGRPLRSTDFPFVSSARFWSSSRFAYGVLSSRRRPPPRPSPPPSPLPHPQPHLPPEPLVQTLPPARRAPPAPRRVAEEGHRPARPVVLGDQDRVAARTGREHRLAPLLRRRH